MEKKNKVMGKLGSFGPGDLNFRIILRLNEIENKISDSVRCSRITRIRALVIYSITKKKKQENALLCRQEQGLVYKNKW